MTSWKLTPEMREEMLADATDPERRQAFLGPQPAADDPGENLERLWRLMRELEPLLARRPPDRKPIRGEFVL